jgi:signal transduction histidine kinase
VPAVLLNAAAWVLLPIVLVGFTTLVLAALHRLWEPRPPLVTLIIPVLFSAYFGGPIGAGVAVATSLLAANLLVPPVGGASNFDTSERLDFLMLTKSGMVAAYMVHRLRSAERTQAEQAHALGLAEEEARTANKLKDQFLATLSHELRTPLNAVLGYTKMALGGAISPERALPIVQRNAEQQARLVEDLLDVAAMSSGQWRLVPQSINIGELLDDCVKAVTPASVARGVRIVHSPDDPYLAAQGDPARLRQVFTNVLVNAVKYTPTGGVVHARARRAGDTARVEVSDTGIGIDPVFLSKVFEGFRRGDVGWHETGSLGLGLPIARAIVQAHQGQIEIASAGHDRGTEVTITLPLDAQ